MATLNLSDETQALLDLEVERCGFATADEAVRVALESLSRSAELETRGEDYEDLDEETRCGIEAAEAEYQQGLGRPWDEVRAELLAKYVHGVGQSS